VAKAAVVAGTVRRQRPPNPPSRSSRRHPVLGTRYDISGALTLGRARRNTRHTSCGRSQRHVSRLRAQTASQVLQFCKDHTEFIDYKDVNLLRKFMTDRGKIKPRASRAIAHSTSTSSPWPSSALARWRSSVHVPVISGRIDRRGGR